MFSSGSDFKSDHPSKPFKQFSPYDKTSLLVMFSPRNKNLASTFRCLSHAFDWWNTVVRETMCH